MDSHAVGAILGMGEGGRLGQLRAGGGGFFHCNILSTNKMAAEARQQEYA